MINFEPKYVHCFWNNKLECKKGFVADTIQDLRMYVEDKAIPYIVSLKASDDENYQFTTLDNDKDYQFCYYDPFYELKVAYEEGKTIQYLSKVTDKWVDCEHRPLWNGDSTDYRIKPEEKKEDKYVPFENTQELIEAWEKKCPANKDRPNGTMPLIWIKEKDNKNFISLITDFTGYGVSTSYKDMSFDSLFEKYTFADGSICGKRK